MKRRITAFWCILLILAATQSNAMAQASAGAVFTTGTQIVKLAGGFKFADGPAADAAGNIYFSDDADNKIYEWDASMGKLSTWLENTGQINGLCMGPDGMLYGSQRSTRRVVSIDMKTKAIATIADYSKHTLENIPNNLWVAPNGGIFFSGIFSAREKGEAKQPDIAFFISPDHSQTIRVTDGMHQCNGIVGTPDGKRLYISERMGKATWVFDILGSGALGHETKFNDVGSDGMTLDARGNLYQTPLNTQAIWVFNPAGKKIAEIAVPEMPSNCEFGGRNGNVLFITARKGLYSVPLNVRGAH